MTVSGAVIALRQLRASDRPRIREMAEATAVFRPAEVDIAIEVFDGAVGKPGVDYSGIGAAEDDRLAGFTLFGPTPGTEATWDLYWIVVDPGAHRHGIGRALTAATERAIASRKGRLIVVETSSRDDYAPTRAFYEALGYTRSARIAHYYAQDDDLIVYTKPLDPPVIETARHG
jgi:ribosomal protein S18 acetylase RimI-like enzyme